MTIISNVETIIKAVKPLLWQPPVIIKVHSVLRASTIYKGSFLFIFYFKDIYTG